MPFEKFVPEQLPQRCTSEEHDPPSHVVLEPGTHTWVCPQCGVKTVVRVSGAYLEGKSSAPGFGDGWPDPPGIVSP